MKKLDENRISPLVSRGDFTRGIPFYGTKGDFNFTAGRSTFTPGISISQVPLTDMSVKGDPGFSEFDMSLSKLKLFFKPGDRVRGTVINSQFENENGKVVVGKLHKIQPNYSNNTVRCWIKNPKTLKIEEVYVQTIEKMYESSPFKALSFSQFINS